MRFLLVKRLTVTVALPLQRSEVHLSYERVALALADGWTADCPRPCPVLAPSAFPDKDEHIR